MAKLKVEEVSIANQLEGTIKLQNDQYLKWRNAANSADVDVLKLDGSDNILLTSANDLFLQSNYVAGVSGAQLFMDGSTGEIRSYALKYIRLATNEGSDDTALTLDGYTNNVFLEANNDVYIQANYSAGVSGAQLFMDGSTGNASLTAKWSNGVTGSILSLAGAGNIDMYAETYALLTAKTNYTINANYSAGVSGCQLSMSASPGNVFVDSALGRVDIFSNYVFGSTGCAIEMLSGADANMNLVADGQINFFTSGFNRWQIDSNGDLVGSGRVDTTGILRTTDGVVINHSGPTIHLQDTNNRSAMVHVNSDIFHILRGDGVNSTNWASYGGVWPLRMELNTLAFTEIGTHSLRIGNSAESHVEWLATGSKTQVWGDTTNGHRLALEPNVMFRPTLDNYLHLGWSNLRWSNIWAVNGTIQTSDAREKTNIQDSTLGLSFVNALRPVSYKWIEGGTVITGDLENNNQVISTVPGQRTHWGLIAQEVKAQLDLFGVDFGGWILTDVNDPDSTQALRYDQFIAPIIKAIQELKADNDSKQTTIDDLLTRVAALETP